MDSFKDFAEMIVRICKHPDTDCMHCPLADDFGCTHGYILADILNKKEEIAKWLKEHRALIAEIPSKEQRESYSNRFDSVEDYFLKVK